MLWLPGSQDDAGKPAAGAVVLVFRLATTLPTQTWSEALPGG